MYFFLILRNHGGVVFIFYLFMLYLMMSVIYIVTCLVRHATNNFTWVLDLANLYCASLVHTLQLLFAMSLDSWPDTSILNVLIRVVSSAYVGGVRTGYQIPFLAVS